MKRILTAAMALSLLGGATAVSAQSYDRDRRDYREDRREARQEYRDEVRDARRDYRDDMRDARRDYRDDRRNDRRWGQRDNRGRYYYGEYRRPSGYQAHRWRRGERLPRGYYAQNYYISDYGRFGLRAPPRGYRWVRVDNDAVLAAIATGVIAEVLADRFYY